MDRVYRDERFPDVEIRNAGSCTFNIWHRTGGNVPGYHSEGEWTNTDCFTSYEHDQTYEVSAEYAEEAAARHFDEWAEGEA
jgi:hypothetical protein